MISEEPSEAAMKCAVELEIQMQRGQTTRGLAFYLQEVAGVLNGLEEADEPHWRETETVRLINFQRADDGDSVTILCNNPDFNGQPNCAIVCNGDWTGWVDKRFAADTVLGA